MACVNPSINFHLPSVHVLPSSLRATPSPQAHVLPVEVGRHMELQSPKPSLASQCFEAEILQRKWQLNVPSQSQGYDKAVI